MSSMDSTTNHAAPPPLPNSSDANNDKAETPIVSHDTKPTNPAPVGAHDGHDTHSAALDTTSVSHEPTNVAQEAPIPLHKIMFQSKPAEAKSSSVSEDLPHAKPVIPEASHNSTGPEP